MDYVPEVSGFVNSDGHKFSLLWIPDNEVNNTALLLYSFLWRQLTSTENPEQRPMESIREMLHVLKLNI